MVRLADFAGCLCWCTTQLQYLRHADPALDQVRVDSVRDRVDPSLFAAIWRAEFPVLLRLGKLIYSGRALARKLLDIFLAGDESIVISNPVHYRSRWGAAEWAPFHRRHGIHVRSAGAAGDSIAQFVPRGYASVVALGDLATRL